MTHNFDIKENIKHFCLHKNLVKLVELSKMSNVFFKLFCSSNKKEEKLTSKISWPLIYPDIRR